MIVYKNLLKANFTKDKGLSHDYLNLMKAKRPISFAKKHKFTQTKDYEAIEYSILLRKKQTVKFNELWRNSLSKHCEHQNISTTIHPIL